MSGGISLTEPSPQRGWLPDARDWPVNRAIATFGALVVLAITAISRFGENGSPALAIGPGLVALAAGIGLLAPDTSVAAHDLRWRRVLGLAVITWGCGQQVVGLELNAGTYQFPSVGDMISVAAVPLVFFGCSLIMRSGATHQPVIRLAIDALLLGSAVCLFVWRLFFFGDPDDAAAAQVLIVEMPLAAFAVLLAIRRPDRGIIVFGMGALTVVIADSVASFRATDGLGPPWIAAVLNCLGFVLFGIGLRSVMSDVADVDNDADLVLRRDGRQSVATLSGVLLALLGVAAVVTLDPASPTRPGILLAALVVITFAARQTLDHRQRIIMFRQLRRQVLVDPLTGLGNRLAVARSAPLTGEPDVVMTGIDGLTLFNERSGHEAGDVIVSNVAAALADAFADELAVARIGEHEFAIVLRGSRNIDGAVRHAHEVAKRALLRRPMTTDAPLTVSSGAAESLPTDRTPVETMARAQRARFVARHASDDGIRVFDAELVSAQERERMIDERLSVALEEVLEVHLQPVVALQPRRVIGVEALARWTDPVLGRVTPMEFIPRAEASGDIYRLGLTVFRMAAQAASDLDFGTRGIRVGVNVSIAQLGCGPSGHRFSDDISEILGEIGLDFGSICLEITESMLLHEHDERVAELRHLSELGVRIAVDDFGSGHWALGYLRWLPADVIKIDRGLIVNLGDDERSRAIVSSIVHLCEQLGIQAIAEGIEDNRTAGVVLDLGVTVGQGWAFAAAVPVVDLPSVIERVENLPT